MPPRKSNVSQASEDGGTPAKEGYGVEDLALPRTMVQRLAKGVLPPNTQIQKDALLAISKSATVFVNYLSSHANEQAQRMNKKTIQPKDVLDAIQDIEFEGFLPRLEAELAKYNTVQCDKRNSYRRKVRDEQKAKLAANGEGEGDVSALSVAEGGAAGAAAGAAVAGAVEVANGEGIAPSPKRGGDEEPRAKKAKGEDGMEIDEDEDADAPDEAEDEAEEEPEEEEEDDDDEDEQFEDAKEELQEDLLEEKRARSEEMEDEALDDGHDSD